MFVDIPLDGFGPADVQLSDVDVRDCERGGDPDPDDVAQALAFLNAAERPVLVVGGDVYWGRAESDLVALAEAGSIPVFVNGMGRGTIPADHHLAFSRARSAALRQADLVMVIGTPLDFRLAFGRFGDARVVHVCDAADQVGRHADLAGSVSGDLALVLSELARRIERPPGRDTWVETLRAEEQRLRADDAVLLEADASPIKPARIYGELRRRLDRDAIVIGDGGDFVSYAGRFVDSYLPGTFLDPGPYGCLGMGPGFALAAGLAHPDRQVVLLLGDGAAGFALGDFESLVRHSVNVTAIVGNNGIWGLEKHPMQMIFGYDVVADLAPGIRYDRVVEAFGGHGELVEEPGALGAALDRAFAFDGPALVNVLTDPDGAYPRPSNLG